MDDVWDELERIYARAEGKSGSIGEALYLSAGFFVDYDKLIDREIQNTIKKYVYSKASNTPPYLSIKKTPIAFIDDFLVIDEEFKAFSDTNNMDSKDIRKK